MRLLPASLTFRKIRFTSPWGETLGECSALISSRTRKWVAAQSPSARNTWYSWNTKCPGKKIKMEHLPERFFKLSTSSVSIKKNWLLNLYHLSNINNYISIYMYIHLYVYIYICIYIYVYIYIYMCVYRHIQLKIRIN